MRVCRCRGAFADALRCHRLRVVRRVWQSKPYSARQSYHTCMEVVMSLATCEGALRASENNPWVELSFFMETENFFIQESSTAGVSQTPSSSRFVVLKCYLLAYTAFSRFFLLEDICTAMLCFLSKSARWVWGLQHSRCNLTLQRDVAAKF